MTGENIRELNGRESSSIEYLAALDSQLAIAETTLQERLKTVPDAWRQFRITRSAMEKVLNALYSTVPNKMLIHMQKLALSGECIIRPRPVVKIKGLQTVPEDELKDIINIVISGKCAFCLDDARTAKKCKLRKALMMIAPPGEIGNADCPYSVVATSNELGEYI